MSNSIVVTVPHNLGAEEAKRRIAEQLEHLRRDYMRFVVAACAPPPLRSAQPRAQLSMRTKRVSDERKLILIGRNEAVDLFASD
jgi:hypothetical protein